MMSRLARRPTRPQRGVTILVVLVLLSVMLLGGLALARMTEIGTLAAGNSAYREAALQASEIGLNSVYALLAPQPPPAPASAPIPNENAAVGTWYRPSTLATVKGWRRIICSTGRAKYSAIVLPLTTTLPEPGLIHTRAIAFLRLPVA